MKPGDAQPELPKGAGEATVARLDKLRLSDGPHSTFAIRRNMQRTMQVRGPEWELPSGLGWRSSNDPDGSC